jgi:hypothetical protein
MRRFPISHPDGDIQEEETLKDWEAFWERVDRVQQKLAGQSFPDSAELIREDRDRPETRPEGAAFE